MRAARGNLYCLQIFAGAESAGVDNPDRTGDLYGFQVVCLVECAISDIDQRIGQDDGAGVFAPVEHAYADGFHRYAVYAVGDDNVADGGAFGHNRRMVGIHAEAEVRRVHGPCLEVVALKLLVQPCAEQFVHHMLQLHAVAALEQEQILLADIASQLVDEAVLRFGAEHLQGRIGAGFLRNIAGVFAVTEHGIVIKAGHRAAHLMMILGGTLAALLDVRKNGNASALPLLRDSGDRLQGALHGFN